MREDNNTVLLADDDASVRFVISKYLTRAGFKVRATDNAQTLMKWVKAGDGDVVLTDVHMDADDIFNFIPALKTARPRLPIIIMSANTSVATALKSGALGVFEYIPKPFDLHHVEKTLQRALGSVEKNGQIRLANKHTKIEPMIGKSIIMQPVFKAISDYMSCKFPVFIYGEVGTGKSHTATLLHEAGERSQRPFIMFDEYDCVQDILDAVGNGDLFVDRVHELTDMQQTMLLRLVERNEAKSDDIAFRVITTANLSPEKLKDTGKVRDDLFYHIVGGDIALPLLSQRSGDIAELAQYFLSQASPTQQKTISKSALKGLEDYHWPGNVRELKRIIQTIALKFSDVVISSEILSGILPKYGMAENTLASDIQSFESIRTACKALLIQHTANITEGEPVSLEQTPYVCALSWVEKPLIEEALRMTGGNNLRAAAILGIHRNTLRTKIKTLNITIK